MFTALLLESNFMVTNPILKYYGSKFRLAKWIISHFPVHTHYVEPFGGGGGVLFQKPISKLETYNDLDKDVYNFFQVLREKPDELIRYIRLTPWSRSEYERCLHNATDRFNQNVENARRLYVRLWMSRHGGTLCTKAAWRRRRDHKSPALDIRPQVLYAAARRLYLVQIENRDALQLIKDFDAPDTLFYLDPPYPASTRSDKKRYACEISDEGHRKLADAICGLKGYAILSGYKCPLYAELFEDVGWKRIDKETMANGGVRRIESLWLSPQTYARVMS